MLHSHQFIRVYVLVWEWICWFCTLDVLVSPRHCGVLFSALWQICRLYTQKFAELIIFGQFTINFLWSVIFDRRAQVWLFFLRPLSSNRALNFLCVHIPNAIKVTKFRTIPMKLWFLRIQNRTFLSQKWPKSTRGLTAWICYQRLKPLLLGLKWRFGISKGGDGWDAEEIILLTIAI